MRSAGFVVYALLALVVACDSSTPPPEPAPAEPAPAPAVTPQPEAPAAADQAQKEAQIIESWIWPAEKGEARDVAVDHKSCMAEAARDYPDEKTAMGRLGAYAQCMLTLGWESKLKKK